MKKMILSVLAFSLVLAVKAQVIPERKPGNPMMHERMRMHRHHREMAMKQLNLTDAQKDQFKEENKRFRSSMEDLKKNEDITVREWKSRMETIRKDHRTRVESIFTTEQKAQLEKMKQEGMAKREEMMKKRMEGMKTRLGLTEDQASRLEKNHKEMAEQMKAIRENKSLSDEQKREKIHELMKTNKETLKSILTEEQLKKMKEGRKPGQPDNDKRPEKKQTI